MFRSRNNSIEKVNLMTEDIEFKRLQWQCRRGMLELDVFLKNFLERAYQKLLPSDKALFSRLLESTDQDLFVWLTGREKPEDSDFARMVDVLPIVV